MQDDHTCPHSMGRFAILGALRSRNKAACLDEGQQEDEEDDGEGVSSKSVQPKLTTTRETLQSLEDVVAFIENRGCTSDTAQVWYFRDLAAALS